MKTLGHITTRAGRKIRHVAPGHVVDVASGMTICHSPSRGISEGGWWVPGAAIRSERDRLPRRLDEWLGHVARAEAVCALVRYLVLSWQEKW